MIVKETLVKVCGISKCFHNLSDSLFILLSYSMFIWDLIQLSLYFTVCRLSAEYLIQHKCNVVIKLPINDVTV